MRRDTLHRLQAECDDVIEAMTRLRADLPELMRRSEHEARDGYPASSIGGGSGSTAINRPTENAALAPPLPDPIRSHVKRVVALLGQTSRNATSLNGLRIIVLDVGEAQPRSIETCGNCRDIESRRLRDERCWACFEYRRRTGRERPAELWSKRRVTA